MKTHGATVLTVPMCFFKGYLACLSLADTLFHNRISESPAFPVSSTDDAIEETSQVCEMVRPSWEKSGTKAAFP